MDNKTYLIQSEKTEKKFPMGKVLEDKTLEDTIAILSGCITSANILDGLKKHLIYDKELSPYYDLADEADNGMEDLLESISDDTSITLTQCQIELLHHGIGLFTEAGEILESLFKGIFIEGGIIDYPNLKEEMCDVEW